MTGAVFSEFVIFTDAELGVPLPMGRGVEAGVVFTGWDLSRSAGYVTGAAFHVFKHV